MALEEYRQDMETCCRCSACKFIPFENVKGYQYVNTCPSISRYNFHAYSGSGRLGMGVALLEKKLEYSPKLLEVVYDCQLCGACDISCKYAMDMEVIEPINEVRIDCVERGHTLPVFDKIAAGLRRQGRMAPAPAKAWFEGLDVRDYTREKVEVVFHAGCRTSADPDLWKVARSAIRLMQAAGVNAGIAGARELCCGGRIYHLGYKKDFLDQAASYMLQVRQSGAKLLVTGCAECYQAFQVLYEKFRLRGDLEIMHTSQFFSRLIGQGKLTPQKNLDLEITYHDPCHLGRLGEPHIPWEGKRLPGQIILFDPPKEFKRGTYGVYAPPREVLSSLPGVRMIEMPRTREYAWCCGAGGGVKENNPGFAAWTAMERIKEAESTGAQALVTACPGCEQSFASAVKTGNSKLQVFDVVELLAKTILDKDI